MGKIKLVLFLGLCTSLAATGCGSGPVGSGERMNQLVFTIQDLNNVVEATVKWEKTHPNSNQVYRDAEGRVVWSSKKLSESKLRELIDYLRISKFIAYSPGTAPLYKGHKYRVSLQLQDGRIFEMVEADACSRMIIAGSGEFTRTHGDCFDFETDN